MHIVPFIFFVFDLFLTGVVILEFLDISDELCGFMYRVCMYAKIKSSNPKCDSNLLPHPICVSPGLDAMNASCRHQHGQL